MTALIVFESMYGSTAAIAEAVAAGLAELRVPVTVCEVGLAGAPSLEIPTEPARGGRSDAPARPVHGPHP